MLEISQLGIAQPGYPGVPEFGRLVNEANEMKCRINLQMECTLQSQVFVPCCSGMQQLRIAMSETYTAHLCLVLYQQCNRLLSLQLHGCISPEDALHQQIQLPFNLARFFYAFLVVFFLGIRKRGACAPIQRLIPRFATGCKCIYLQIVDHSTCIRQPPIEYP